VTSLSTEVFLNALERFINTRGRPITIYSDNGSNFVGLVNITNCWTRENPKNLSTCGVRIKIKIQIKIEHG